MPKRHTPGGGGGSVQQGTAVDGHLKLPDANPIWLHAGPDDKCAAAAAAAACATAAAALAAAATATAYTPYYRSAAVPPEMLGPVDPAVALLTC